MTKQTLRVLAGLSALLLAMFVLGSAPAVAGGKDPDKGGGSGYTEDNDTNDGDTPNNVADEGDNKHPSGKDRSVEHGKGGTQGKSDSDPDGDENGGLDKANGTGGDDSADQDGNNGCGNDDDFEDDNNGNCGKPKDDEPPVVGGTPPPCDKDSTMPGVQPCDEDDVDGGVITSPPDDDVDGGVITSPPDDDVLGGRIYRPGARPTAPAVAAAALTRGGALPFTGGGDMVPYAVLALGLIAVGALVLRGRRHTS